LPEQKSNHIYSNNPSIIEPIYPKEELISDEYVQNILTSDMVADLPTPYKIPVSNAQGKIDPNWLSDNIATTTLPVASDDIAGDKDNNTTVMTPHSTYISITKNVKDASTTQKGIVQLTSRLDSATLLKDDLAITPKALKEYLNDGFAIADYSVPGITKFAEISTLNAALSASKTSTNSALRSNENYSKLAVNPYTLYRYISDNNLTLNSDANIIFRKRTENGSSATSEDIAKITVNRPASSTSTSALKATVKNKTATLLSVSSDGNTVSSSFPGTVTVDNIKIGSTDIGSNSIPVYIKKGVISPCTDIVSSIQSAIDNAPYLPLAGGTVTGQITINGTHNGLNKRAILITGNNQSHAFAVQDTGLTKGTAPSSTRTIEGVAMYGNEMDSSNKLISDFYTTVDASNTTKTILKAFNVSTATNQTGSSLTLVAQSDGANYASLSQTPATTDNSTKIATTAYVKNNLSNYLPLAGGTITGAIYNKDTGATKGTKPTSNRWQLNYMYTDKNNVLFGGMERGYLSDGTNRINMIVYPGTTNNTDTNAQIGVGFDGSGNWFTYAPTPATSDASTKIATTAFVKAQGYIPRYTNVSEMGRYIDMHYDNSTAKYDYDVRLYVNSQGTAAGNGELKIAASKVTAGTFSGNLTGNVSGTSSNVTGVVAIRHGGTGATSRTAAVRALFDEGVEGSATHLLGITSDWSKCGYVYRDSLKSILGLGNYATTDFVRSMLNTLSNTSSINININGVLLQGGFKKGSGWTNIPTPISSYITVIATSRSNVGRWDKGGCTITEILQNSEGKYYQFYICCDRYQSGSPFDWGAFWLILGRV
jgi:hypothetical protein